MQHLFLFDIDGTLLRADGAGRGAMEQAIQEIIGMPQALQGIRLGGRIDYNIVHEVIDSHLATAPTQRSERSALYAAICERYAALLPDYLNTCEPAARLLDGVSDTLEWLSTYHPNAVMLGIGTGNMIAGARHKLAHCGIYDFFSVGGYGNDAEARPGVLEVGWQRAMELAPTIRDRQQVLVIGDTEKDILAARAAGMKVAAVATGSSSLDELRDYEPDHLWESMSDGLCWMKEHL